MKSNKSKLSRKQGFTLIELLVVVVLIIGILAAVAVPQYRVAVAKSRLSQALILSKALYDAQQIYYVANGKYTLSMDDLDISAVSCTKKNESSLYYNCGNNTQINFTEVPSVYVLLLNSEGRLFIERYFKKDLVLCGSSFDSGKKACLNMGGTYYAENDTGKIVYYKI